MYVIYEYQSKYDAMVNVGQSDDTNFKRAIIKATSRYRFNKHSFELHFCGDNRVKRIDNRPMPEF